MLESFAVSDIANVKKSWRILIILRNSSKGLSFVAFMTIQIFSFKDSSNLPLSEELVYPKLTSTLNVPSLKIFIALGNLYFIKIF